MDLASLEAEALLLGIWRNIEDLEECLNLPELNAILEAAQKRERARQRFYAAFKGVDLDKDENNAAQEAFDRANRRAQAKLRGIDEEEFQRMEDSEIFGLDFEIEE